jgi:hypothetical protein
MSGTAFPSTVTQVDLGTTASPQRFPLGYEVTLPATKGGAGGVDNNAGPQTWIYVHASVVLATGEVCSHAATATTYSVRLLPANSHAGGAVGVAQHAIASGSYGFIQKRGKASVLADGGGVTANLGMMAGDVAGTADAAGAVTTASFGIACATGASAAVECFIDCRA